MTKRHYHGDNRDVLREYVANDHEFLKSLYSLPLDRHARFHRGRLLQDMIAARTIEKNAN